MKRHFIGIILLTITGIFLLRAMETETVDSDTESPGRENQDSGKYVPEGGHYSYIYPEAGSQRDLLLPVSEELVEYRRTNNPKLLIPAVVEFIQMDEIEEDDKRIARQLADALLRVKTIKMLDLADKEIRDASYEGLEVKCTRELAQVKKEIDEETAKMRRLADKESKLRRECNEKQPKSPRESRENRVLEQEQEKLIALLSERKQICMREKRKCEKLIEELIKQRDVLQENLRRLRTYRDEYTAYKAFLIQSCQALIELFLAYKGLLSGAVARQAWDDYKKLIVSFSKDEQEELLLDLKRFRGYRKKEAWSLWKWLFGKSVPW